MNNLVRIIFYGNIFYGLCAVALCIETNLLSGLNINHFPFYLLIFFGTWIYYTMIYIRSTAALAQTSLNTWYRNNLKVFKAILFVVITVELVLLVYLVLFSWQPLRLLPFSHWLMLASVPAAGLLYTFDFPVPFIKKFRQVGWLKPLTIGITWAGWVTLYPVIIWNLQYGNMQQPVNPSAFLWIINFLFVTILAIIFDVKDYNIDTRKELKTIPAQLGIATSYNWVIIPATLLTLVLALYFQIGHGFTFAQIIIQLLPFALLLLLEYKPRQHSLLYYLVVVDGLMLLKGLTGIISIYFL